MILFHKRRTAGWAIALLGAGLLLLGACKDRDRSSRDRTFYLNLSSGSLESLDPAYAKDLYTMWTVHMLFNTLVEADAHQGLVPSLATRWEASPDARTYTFFLRSDVFFQDNPLFPGGKGRRMTARDVVYSFNRLIDPSVASSGAWVFNDRVLKDEPFQAPDDTTVVIRLSAPFQALPAMLSMPYCSIVPEEVAAHWGKDFRRHPCGTGPFMYFEWDEGNALTFHRNPHYWERDSSGQALPYIDAVQLSFFDSKATEFLLFLQQKLDFVNNIDGSFKDLVLSKHGDVKEEFAGKFRLDKNPYLNTEYLGILVDTTNPLLTGAPTRHRLVRQAINYGIDRQQIATYFRNGLVQPATGGFIPMGLPGSDTARRIGYRYDPAKAAALLEKAGFPQGKGLGVITILTPDNYADIVNFVASQLQDLGLQVKVEIIQPNILRQQMSSSKAVVFRAQWIADYPDAETYLAFFNSRFPAPPNYTRFKNATFDRWYDEAMALPDTVRWELYHRMDSLAMSEAPVVPLFYDQRLHFLQNRVQGFSSNPMNILELKRVKLER